MNGMEIADFASEHGYSDLPQSVREHTKMAILNTIAVSVGANKYPQSMSVVKACRAIQEGKFPIMGSGETSGLISSTWANSALSHFLDFDDTHLETVVHPSSPVIPSAMAVGMDLKSDGKLLIYASAIGMETAIRLGLSVGLDETYSDWHNTSLYGSSASAAGCSVMKGHTSEVIHASMFQGLTVATGFLSNKGTTTKSFQVGRSSAEGLISSIAAENGVSVSDNIFNTFSKSLKGNFKSERLTANFGTEWELLKNFLKPYPCGVVLHPGIDAAIKARTLKMEYREVESIHVYVNPIVKVLTAIMEPQTGLQSKFSITHAIACAMVHGPLYPEHFSDESVRDPSVLALRKKITVHESEGINRGQTRIVLKMQGGRTETAEINRGPATPSKELSLEELRLKYDHLVIPVLGEEKSLEAWNFFSSIEKKGDLSEIMEIFQ